MCFWNLPRRKINIKNGVMGIDAAGNWRRMFAVAAAQIALQKHGEYPQNHKSQYLKLGPIVKSYLWVSFGKTCMLQNHGAWPKEHQHHYKTGGQYKIKRGVFLLVSSLLKSFRFLRFSFPKQSKGMLWPTACPGLILYWRTCFKGLCHSFDFLTFFPKQWVHTEALRGSYGN